MRFGVAIGQAIFTPSNISEEKLIESDRPYAGWLYSTFSLTSDGRSGSSDSPQLFRYANAFNIAYTRLWQYPLSKYIDITPQFGFSVGNIYTFASTGVMLRFGYPLGKDFGPPLIRPRVTPIKIATVWIKSAGSVICRQVLLLILAIYKWASHKFIVLTSLTIKKRKISLVLSILYGDIRPNLYIQPSYHVLFFYLVCRALTDQRSAFC